MRSWRVVFEWLDGGDRLGVLPLVVETDEADRAEVEVILEAVSDHLREEEPWLGPPVKVDGCSRSGLVSGRDDEMVLWFGWSVGTRDL